jgi:hypothetical protein
LAGSSCLQYLGVGSFSRIEQPNSKVITAIFPTERVRPSKPYDLEFLAS